MLRVMFALLPLLFVGCATTGSVSVSGTIPVGCEARTPYGPQPGLNLSTQVNFSK